MKKIKIIIAILSSIFFVLVVTLSFVNIYKKKYTNTAIHDKVGGSSIYKLDLRIEDNKKRYYGIENKIKNYFSILNEEDIALYANIKREQYICSILNDNYIKENNITEENVWNYIRPFGKNKHVIINEMYVRETSEYFVEYVHVVLYEKDQLDNKYNFNYNFDKKDMYYRFNVDNMNSTYDIQPISQEEFNNKQIVANDEINIDKNEYNTISFSINPTDAAMSIKYLDNYKEKMRYDIEAAYMVLDENYRNKRFGSLEKYKEYVFENKDWLDTILADKYQSNYKDNYKEYVCVDKNYNYYVFKETAIMQYTLELDTYTLENEKFVTEYNESDEPTKVQMNINKFILMINNQDYDAAYNVLANSFKNNYFQTKEDFVKYAKQKFYRYNNIKIKSCDKQGNTYICKTVLSDLTNGVNKNSSMQTGSQFELNVAMQLGEGYEFVMSFETGM